MNKLDKKFDGVIFKVKDGTIVPPDQYIVFLAKDDALPATLEFYLAECERTGADARQISAVIQLIRDVLLWRNQHRELCKVPDVSNADELLR